MYERMWVAYNLTPPTFSRVYPCMTIETSVITSVPFPRSYHSTCIEMSGFSVSLGMGAPHEAPGDVNIKHNTSF